MSKGRIVAGIAVLLAGVASAGALLLASEAGKPAAARVPVASLPDTVVPVDPMQRVQDLKLFVMPPGGVDHLYFEVTDTIEVPGMGEDVVTLNGTYKIRRSDPSTDDWATATIDVEMIDLDVKGSGRLIGPVHASLNPERTTIGRVGPVGGDMRSGKTKPAPCRFQAYMQLTLPERGLVLVNQEPIPLVHEITHVPPIGQGGGTPGEVAIAFYDKRTPGGPPVAVLKRVKTQIGRWVG